MCLFIKIIITAWIADINAVASYPCTIKPCGYVFTHSEVSTLPHIVRNQVIISLLHIVIISLSHIVIIISDNWDYYMFQSYYTVLRDMVYTQMPRLLHSAKSVNFPILISYVHYC